MGMELRKTNAYVEGIAFIPMIIPDIVMAISLLSFFTLIQLTLGLHSIIISHIVFNIAFVCAVVRTRFRYFDHRVIEASYDLGARRITTFFKITFPICGNRKFLSFDGAEVAASGPEYEVVAYCMQTHAVLFLFKLLLSQARPPMLPTGCTTP